MTFAEAVEWAGKAIDASGVAIIALGIVYATVVYAIRWRHGPAVAQYQLYRQTIGRVILLGLEFLVAGDIVRTVATDPTFRSVGVLAVIVAIRTFLSLELELEIEGRFPWQRLAPGGGDSPRVEGRWRSQREEMSAGQRGEAGNANKDAASIQQ